MIPDENNCGIRPHKEIWNPWHGCTKISPGCKNCYMYALDRMREVQKPSNEFHVTGNFKYPLSKFKDGTLKVQPGERLRVNMTSDTFLKDADEIRPEMWNIIKKRPDVIFWILTKRADRIADNLPDDWGDGYDNVSINITCENQEMFNKRIDYLLNLPAKHKGLCLAPLLSDINITYALKSGQVEEIETGGENYDDPRPCNYDWIKHIAEQCKEYKINFCWYETGTRFIKDNKEHYIPNKRHQCILPFLAGLNQHYYDLEFDLKDQNGNTIPKEQYYKKAYNIDKCLCCGNQQVCNGCTICGNCKQTPRLLSMDDFLKYQEQFVNANKINTLFE